MCFMFIITLNKQTNIAKLIITKKRHKKCLRNSWFQFSFILNFLKIKLIHKKKIFTRPDRDP
jgi:hypothetical protein